MILRIIGVLMSLTFFGTAASLLGDPNCVSVETTGGRFLSVTCLPYQGAQDAKTFAVLLIVAGLFFAGWNLWPWITQHLLKRYVSRRIKTGASEETVITGAVRRRRLWNLTPFLALLLIIGVSLIFSNLTKGNSGNERLDGNSSYAPNEVISAAGKGFEYVGNGFAYKSASEGFCTDFDRCFLIDLYSSTDCNSTTFFLDVQTNSSGESKRREFFVDTAISLGETKLIEIESPNNAKKVSILEVRCSN